METQIDRQHKVRVPLWSLPQNSAEYPMISIQSDPLCNKKPMIALQCIKFQPKINSNACVVQPKSAASFLVKSLKTNISNDTGKP